MKGLTRVCEKSARFLYVRVPGGWATRLWIKDALFRMLPAVFRHTNAYRRWEWFQARELPHGRLASGPFTEDVRQSHHARYLGDLFAMSASSHGDSYVPLSEAPAPALLRGKAIAFYLPQFHPIPENNEWWGRGFTEWTNVSKALPQFVGHDQPHLPGELGFYDLRLKEVMIRQVELAKQYGLSGFCFHYYWFSGRRLLEGPLDMFLASAEIEFPFCLSWANENWTRRWDGLDEDVLLSQDYTDDNDERFIRDTVRYMRDPRYIKVGDRPLLIIYRPSLLPDARRTVAHWREYCRSHGLGEIFVAMVQFDVDDPRIFGIDAALEFPPHKLARSLPLINDAIEIVNRNYSGLVMAYDDLARRGEEWPAAEFPLFKGVSPRWDNEARKPGCGFTFANSTPERYGNWLSKAVDYANEHPVRGESIVFINAWNEWAEGAHLEPDRRHGYAYLQATRDALTRERKCGKVVIVCHDAHPHGAQYLTLNLVRELTNGLGLQVEILLLGSGILEDSFRELAPVHSVYDRSKPVEDILSSLSRRGFKTAIANTAVSGRIVPQITEAGIHVVALVHELPGVIREYELERAVEALGLHANEVVVASEAVRDGLCGFLRECDRVKVEIRPQGLFVRSRYRSITNREEPRRRLREQLSLAMDTKVVLSVGYADKRKGVDLLARVAGRCRDIHFVWVGHRDATIKAEIDAILDAENARSRFHFVGMDFETDDYYAGADVFALASREDPFPSVLLESLSVGTPAVAFAGTGGGADLIVGRKCGVTAPAFDVGAYADALSALVNDKALRETLGESGRSLVEAEFSFRRYAMDIIAKTPAAIPRVSVVVPNYNYAHYLEARLRSISEQTFPVYEIIVLDDCSTDESIITLRSLGASIHPDPQLHVNERNSGSVFRQWLSGVARTNGDLVWIAEADDLAKPEFLEVLVAALAGAPEAAMAYCQSEQIDQDGNLLASSYHAYTDDLSSVRWHAPYVCTGADEVIAGMSVKNTIPNVSAVLFRRAPLLEVLEKYIAEISSYQIAGDWLVYLKLLRTGGVAFIPEAMNRHRRHGSSVTIGSAAQTHFDEIVRVQDIAVEMFSLDSDARKRASAYRTATRGNLGLDTRYGKADHG